MEKGHTSGTTITDDDTLHGTTLAGSHGVNLVAGRDMTLTATQVASSKGAIALQAGHDIALNAGHEEHDWSKDTYSHRSSLLSSRSTTTHDATQDNFAIGTSLSGEAVSIAAAHDLTTQAAQIAGTHDVALAAGHDLTIGTGKDHHAEQYSIRKKKSGVFGGGGASGLGGIGFTVGSQKAGATSTIDQHTTTGSLIGSTQGNVALVAGGNLNVIGSDLIAGRAKDASSGGNIMLQGKNVTITSAAQTDHETDSQHHSQHGLSMALVGTPLDGAKDVQATRHEQASSGKKTMDTLRALGAMAGDMPGVAIGYGSQHSSQSSQFDSTTQRGSSVRAAGDLAIDATGGDLIVIGSALSAGGKATLEAQQNVALLASVATQSQSHQSHNQHKSYTLAPISGGDVARHLDGGPNHSGVSMSPYNSKTSNAQGGQHIVNETGTTVSADQINIVSHQGDITTQGAQLAVQGNINVLASQGNITLGTGTASQTGQNHSTTHSLGDQGGDGYSGTIGERQEQHDQQGRQTSQSGLRTELTSAHGDVNVIAHGDLTGQGVDIAGRDVTLIGKNVILTPSQDTSAQKQHSHVSHFGVTLAMSGVAVQAAKAADAAVAAHDRGDNRLAALYGAEAAYGASDSVGEAHAINYGRTAEAASGNAVGAGSAPNGGSNALIKATVSIGGGHQTSDSASLSRTQQGSTIKASRDLTIVATGDGTQGADGYASNGDIIMQGAQVSAGRNASLIAARDIDLLSSQDTSKQTKHHQSSSASIGVGFALGGEQNGFTIELAAAAAKGKGKGNGTTHTATQLSAGNTLSLTSGRDTTLYGAQASGQTILADIGRNLTLTSTQDSNHYKEKDQSASAGLSLCIPPICYGTSSGGASYNQTDIRNNYQSVTDQTGLAAGAGGFQIYVGGTTALTGAAIASTAEASKNLLDTGNLTLASLHNKADSSASQVGGSYSSSGSLGSNLMSNAAGAALSMAVPQGSNHNSDTASRIAQGTITVRNHPGQDLTGIDRDATTLDGHGVNNDFDLDKIKENQALGQAAGYVGMRTVGAIAEHERKAYEQAEMAKQAAEGDLQKTTDPARRIKLKQVISTSDDYMSAHQTHYDAWSDGGANKVLLHGLVGAATAALGGGNALQGALGATASEAASSAMQHYLHKQGIDPNSAKGKSLMGLASTVIGGVAGQGAGAATALQGEKYNRQLHSSEIAWLRTNGKAFAQSKCGCSNPSKTDIAAATQELTRQALRQVDARWSTVVGTQNDSAAEAWISTHKPEGTIGYSSDAYFTATTSEYNNPIGYAASLNDNPTNLAFVQKAAGVYHGSLLGHVKGGGIGLAKSVKGLWYGLLELPGAVKSIANGAVTTVGLVDQGKWGILKQKTDDRLHDAWGGAVSGYVNTEVDSIYGGYSADTAGLTFAAFQLFNPVEKLNALNDLAKVGDTAKLAELASDAGKVGKLKDFKEVESAALADAAKDGGTAATEFDGSVANQQYLLDDVAAKTAAENRALVEQIPGLSQTEYEDLLKDSVHHTDSYELVLGKYEGTPDGEGGVDMNSPSDASYNTVAKKRGAMYFDMGSKWGKVQEKYDLTNEQMFQLFNKPALDKAATEGKVIKFTHNPMSPKYDGRAIREEFDYLKSNYGYKKVVLGKDGIWYAK